MVYSKPTGEVVVPGGTLVSILRPSVWPTYGLMDLPPQLFPEKTELNLQSSELPDSSTGLSAQSLKLVCSWTVI